MLVRSALLILLSISIGCSHLGPKSEVQSAQADREKPVVQLKEVDSFRVTDPDGPKVTDNELEQIPTEINPLVEKWVDYFQGRGRPHMERYLARSTRYSKLMKKILRQNGLPEDLIYIALIESGFSHQATSSAAAVGYWQFIRGTGRRYGLETNALIDERRDPVMSTQAAAEYFKGLYSVFGSWYLAMASYNVGENRVKREVMNNYTRDFWELARKRRFPKETVNYIPKFIAAKMIGNNPEKYGFTNIEYMTPIEFDHIKISTPVNLKTMAAKMGLEYDDLKMLNPKFKGEVAPLKGDSLELRVPIGQVQVAMNAASESVVTKVEYVAEAADTQVYRIRPGDSLYGIARKYRTTVAWLRDVNDISKNKKLRIGQRIAVPDRSGSVAKKSASKPVIAKVEKLEDTETATIKPEITTSKGVFYVVQSGDTLSAIADDYDSSIEELRKMNKLSRKSILKVGMKLKVPKDEGLPADPSGAKPTLVKEEKSDDSASVANADLRGPSSTKTSHTVRSGENLYVIAKKYGVSIQQLQKVNKLSKKSVLKVGAVLTIPGNGTSSTEVKINKAMRTKFHVVKRGENLSLIADKYSIPLGALRAKNNISSGSKLLVGSRLSIPVARN